MNLDRRSRSTSQILVNFEKIAKPSGRNASIVREALFSRRCLLRLAGRDFSFARFRIQFSGSNVVARRFAPSYD